MMERIPVGS